MAEKEGLVDVDRSSHHRRLEGHMLNQVGCLDEWLEPRIGRRRRRNVLLLRNPRRELRKWGRNVLSR
jgi:hypothetical protein